MTFDYQVTADFWNKDGIIYRNNTKLIFNEIFKYEGIVVMLNPGKCLPKNPQYIKNTPQTFYSNKFPLLNKDQTQGKIVKCVLEAYENKLHGNIIIINISNKRETNPAQLSMGDFRKSEDILKEIIELDGSNTIKWIWIAFGKNSYGNFKKDILTLKNNIRCQLMNLFNDKIIGASICIHPGQGFYGRIREDITYQIKNVCSKPLVREV